MGVIQKCKPRKEVQKMRKLESYLNKKQRAMIESIESESGLVDDCKYMVYLKESFTFAGYETSFPVTGIRELREFMEDVEQYHMGMGASTSDMP